MNDCVLSYHLNPQTCGVSKWNYELARRLGVPIKVLAPVNFHAHKHPLVSIKFDEISTSIGWPGNEFSINQPYDLFAHDFKSSWMDWYHIECWIKSAQRVFVGNRALSEAMREIRPDVVAAWCPATISGNPDRGTYRVLTFGMAHKLALERFRFLKMELDREHPDYTVALSTAVHEGSPWDTALTESVEAMRGIFGHRLRVLGYLGDDALAKELQDCDAVAVYFDPAVRENNTTIWAALAAGKPVYTNTDAYSPDLDPAKYSWDGLTDLLCGSGPS